MIEAPLRLLLGPQNPVRNVGKAMDEARVFDGPVAVISAAWQEAENDIDDVRGHPVALIGFSEPFAEAQQSLKQFLRAHLYRHPKVTAMTSRARDVVTRLFDRYLEQSDRMPTEHAELASRARMQHGEAAAARVVADYIAGMTDRFALQADAELGRRG